MICGRIISVQIHNENGCVVYAFLFLIGGFAMMFTGQHRSK